MSFVIPCYKSEDTIADVIKEIKKEIKKLNCEYEIFLIDDCSPDKQMELFKELAVDKRIKVSYILCQKLWTACRYDGGAKGISW